MRAVRGAQNAVVRQQLRELNPKFHAGPNELEQEPQLKILQPTNAEQLKQLTALVEALRRQNLHDPAWQNALRLWQMQITTGALSDAVKLEFVRRFYFWLLGRGTDADVAKTFWGRGNAAVINREVALYIQQFSQRRLDYALQLALLAGRVPETLNGYYLYFKYIVNGKLKRAKDHQGGMWWELSDDDYLQDFELFQQEFDNETQHGAYKDIIGPTGGRPSANQANTPPPGPPMIPKTNTQMVQNVQRMIDAVPNEANPPAGDNPNPGATQAPVQNPIQAPQPTGVAAEAMGVRPAATPLMRDETDYEPIRRRQAELEITVSRLQQELLTARTATRSPTTEHVQTMHQVARAETAAIQKQIDEMREMHGRGANTIERAAQAIEANAKVLTQMQQFAQQQAAASPTLTTVHALGTEVRKAQLHIEQLIAKLPKPPDQPPPGGAATPIQVQTQVNVEPLVAEMKREALAREQRLEELIAKLPQQQVQAKMPKPPDQPPPIQVQTQVNVEPLVAEMKREALIREQRLEELMAKLPQQQAQVNLEPLIQKLDREFATRGKQWETQFAELSKAMATQMGEGKATTLNHAQDAKLAFDKAAAEMTRAHFAKIDELKGEQLRLQQQSADMLRQQAEAIKRAEAAEKAKAASDMAAAEAQRAAAFAKETALQETIRLAKEAEERFAVQTAQAQRAIQEAEQAARAEVAKMQQEQAALREEDRLAAEAAAARRAEREAQRRQMDAAKKAAQAKRREEEEMARPAKEAERVNAEKATQAQAIVALAEQRKQKLDAIVGTAFDEVIQEDARLRETQQLVEQRKLALEKERREFQRDEKQATKDAEKAVKLMAEVIQAHEEEVAKERAAEPEQRSTKRTAVAPEDADTEEETPEEQMQAQMEVEQADIQEHEDSLRADAEAEAELNRQVAEEEETMRQLLAMQEEMMRANAEISIMHAKERARIASEAEKAAEQEAENREKVEFQLAQAKLAKARKATQQAVAKAVNILSATAPAVKLRSETKTKLEDLKAQASKIGMERRKTTKTTEAKKTKALRYAARATGRQMTPHTMTYGQMVAVKRELEQALNIGQSDPFRFRIH
jgi:hypothetical protein